jgi:polar amino acid transport system substrate-binding protein
MKVFLITITAVFFLPMAMADQSLSLGNSDWPPFIIEGQDRGASEELVCEALKLAGWTCSVKVYDWDKVLEDAQKGSVDGIAAVWRTPEREQYLLFSEPYLTNRIVPIVAKDSKIFLQKPGDLAGWRVAMVPDYAYGEEIESAKSSFTLVPVRESAEAIKAVQEDRADIALVDDLVAHAQLEIEAEPDFAVINAVLAYRELYFAVSRAHPQAEQIISDFHHHYETMLKDGAVNEILGVDWLATDLGNDGKLDLVLRSGVSFDDLDAPSQGGSTYALGQSQYQMMSQSNMGNSQVNYHVEGKSHSSLQSALVEVFGKDVVCSHKEYTSQFDCSKLFMKR